LGRMKFLRAQRGTSAGEAREWEVEVRFEGGETGIAERGGRGGEGRAAGGAGGWGGVGLVGWLLRGRTDWAVWVGVVREVDRSV